ncbi:Baculoviral IAP repeat-containing protein 5 [Diaporthe australafricana]|uniref:Baculoviral IAP repeat-containing protein 5 n=1 Tax=Diaporthe australafricana TaxID=127596 RepID=A0ABR3Y7H8_9PEZI
MPVIKALEASDATNATNATQPSGLDEFLEMPPRAPKKDPDLKSYFQYHNRIASFLDWQLDWELNDDKPSPEKMARAGFFFYVKANYKEDTVMCPDCGVTAFDWEPNDDPLGEHMKASPHCEFARRQAVLIQVKAAKAAKAAKDAEKLVDAKQEAAASEQKNASNVPQQKRPYKKRAAAGISKADELATAEADQDDGDKPKKRRAPRAKKQSGPA